MGGRRQWVQPMSGRNDPGPPQKKKPPSSRPRGYARGLPSAMAKLSFRVIEKANRKSLRALVSKHEPSVVFRFKSK